MIRSLTHHGQLIRECGLPGETRADWVTPAHGNGIQLSRDRFLILNSTLGFRGVDDNLSITCQIRADGWDGPLLREKLLAKSIDDWDPPGGVKALASPGCTLVRQFGHPVAFGVPRGAIVAGREPAHANLFVIQFRVCARELTPAGNLTWNGQPPAIHARTQAVWWLQCRLSEAGDDLEIIREVQPLRQHGFAEGPACCEQDIACMNQTYTQPVAWTDDGSEWACVNHVCVEGIEGQFLAPMRYRFDAASGLYQWVETGPLIGPGYYEGSLARWRDRWVIAGRRGTGGHGIGWACCDDPFATPARLELVEGIGGSRTPLSVYTGADGVLRLLSGDERFSPHRRNRDPLYLWDIDPAQGFRATACHTVFDGASSALPVDPGHPPIVDMGKLLPHAGGDTQTILHRVRTAAMRVSEADMGGPPYPLTQGDFDSTGLYYATVRLDQAYPGQWQFA